MRAWLLVGVALFLCGVQLIRDSLTWQGILVGWIGLGLIGLVFWWAIVVMSKDDEGRR